MIQECLSYFSKEAAIHTKSGRKNEELVKIMPYLMDTVLCLIHFPLNDFQNVLFFFFIEIHSNPLSSTSQSFNYISSRQMLGNSVLYILIISSELLGANKLSSANILPFAYISAKDLAESTAAVKERIMWVGRTQIQHVDIIIVPLISWSVIARHHSWLLCHL